MESCKFIGYKRRHVVHKISSMIWVETVINSSLAHLLVAITASENMSIFEGLIFKDSWSSGRDLKTNK